MLGQTDLRVRDYVSGSVMAPHEHAEASLNIVVSGSYVERIGKSERRYASGFVAYCPEGTTHSQIFGAHGARQVISVPDRDCLGYLADSRLDLPSSPYVGSAGLSRLGHKLAGELQNTDALSVVAREGLLLEIVAAFGRKTSASASSRRPPQWLRAAHEFLRAHAFGPFTLTQMAKTVGRHQIHVAREFRRHYGEPVGSYVRRLRIERAAKLLGEPTPGISEIALRCGFASHSHLCREFKNQFGCTPSAYRDGLQ